MEKRSILEYLEKNIVLYRFDQLTLELQNDPDIILAYAKAWPRDIYDMKKEFFHSNREYMELLVTTNMELCYLDKEYLEDAELMKLAIINRPWAAFYVTNKSIIDKDLALYIVRAEGRYLEYVGEVLQDDEEVVIEAIRKDKDAIKYASKRLQFQLQNMIFTKKYNTDDIVLQSSLNSIEIKTAKLRKLQSDVELLMHQIEELTEEINQDIQSAYKVKQKHREEKGAIMVLPPKK